MQTLGDLIRLNAKRYPKKTAVIFGTRKATFGELNLLVNRLAHWLISLGVEPGDRVGIWSENCLEYLVIKYAVCKCGAILVPINYRYKSTEMTYVVNNCGIKVLFFDQVRSYDFNKAQAQKDFSVPVLPIFIPNNADKTDDWSETILKNQSPSEIDSNIAPESPALIMYTSGTTGFPKGVLFTHANVLACATGMIYEGELEHEEVMLVCMPLFHNGALNCTVVPAFMAGCTCIITSGSFDPEQICSTIIKHNVSVTHVVPTMLARLVMHLESNRSNVLPLKKIWYGSSAIGAGTLNAARNLLKAKFYQWYGQTETNIVSVLKPYDHIDKANCTGREIFNSDIRIVDEHGLDVPQGCVGELISRQKPLGMDRYWGLEDSADKTIDNGWIYTGDLARVEGSGYFTVVDRLKDMIISGGENIYSKEVENVIGKLEGVSDVAVFGIPDETWGESVCAAVILKSGYTLTENDVISYCRGRLADYKKPKSIEFVTQLPRNAAGKVMKNVLREPYWTGLSKRV